MKNLLNFLNSAAGLLILGFLLTTGVGTWLNQKIQDEKSHNEENFEMYKTRLAEAKNLQEKLLKLSTKRLFYLAQILGKLEDQSTDTEEYWKGKYSRVKDDWNKNVINFHAQMRTLFTEKKANLSSLLYADCEDPVTTEDLVKKNLQYMPNKDEYEKKAPKTVHGAFVVVHATIYKMALICRKPVDDGRNTVDDDCKEWNRLMELAHKQMDYLKLLHSCLSYGMSSQLLSFPYGPQTKEESKPPKLCDEVFTKAIRQDKQSENIFEAGQCTSEIEN